MFSKGKPEPGDTVASGASKQQSSVPSIVSPDLTVTGNLKSTGDIQVDGRVEGDVDAANLTIGENGMIQGTVRASAVHVCGSIQGELHATSVTLASTAHIQGDIVHESLAIEAGAYLDGHCRRQDASQQPPASSAKRSGGASTSQRGTSTAASADVADTASDGRDGGKVTNMAGTGTANNATGGVKRGQ